MLQNAYFLAKIGYDTATHKLNLSKILPIGVAPGGTAPAPRALLAPCGAGLGRRGDEAAERPQPAGLPLQRSAFPGSIPGCINVFQEVLRAPQNIRETNVECWSQLDETCLFVLSSV